MTALTTKLNVKLDSVTSAINLYTTTEEVAPNYLTALVPGESGKTTAYAKLVTPNYYKWTTWTQPIFTAYTASDGSVISASSEGASWANYAWRAMDGHTSGGDGNFWQTISSSTGWWKVVFPYKIAITKLVHYNRDNTSYSSITGQYFADVAMTIPIGSSFTNTTSWGTTTVYDSSTPIVTDTIYFNKTAGHNSSGIGELVITAQKAVESTSDDYDYLTYPYSEANIYYKYSTTWTQPTLSANGTLGSGTFSCAATSEYYPAWKAFNNTAVDGSDCWFSTSIPQSILWYSSTAICISSLRITNRNYSDGLHAVRGATLYGSSDNNTWHTITSFTNDVTTYNASWDVSITGRIGYNYFKLTVTDSDGEVGISKIAITATSAAVSTASDYDYAIASVVSPLSVTKEGISYRVLTVGNVSYTEVNYTTPGTYTFTVPEGITKLKVAVCGGGAGAASSSGYGTYTGGNGGTSSAAGVAATGGTGGHSFEESPPTDPCGS